MMGKHLIVDIHNISNSVLLTTVEGVEPLMRKMVEVGNLHVVGDLKHQFKPKGATILYLLSESYLSIHTYPETNYSTIDLYSCNPLVNMGDILDCIYQYFNGDCFIMKKIIDR